MERLCLQSVNCCCCCALLLAFCCNCAHRGVVQSHLDDKMRHSCCSGSSLKHDGYMWTGETLDNGSGSLRQPEVSPRVGIRRSSGAGADTLRASSKEIYQSGVFPNVFSNAWLRHWSQAVQKAATAYKGARPKAILMPRFCSFS